MEWKDQVTLVLHFSTKGIVDGLVRRYCSPGNPEEALKIYCSQVFVDDQQKALEFYTKILGFNKKHDMPLGKDRWLTLTSPGDDNGVELLLEPCNHPAVSPFRNAMVEDGIPYNMFSVDDIESEYARLTELGVKFVQPPVAHEGYSTAVFDDTCGNLIQIIELADSAK